MARRVKKLREMIRVGYCITDAAKAELNSVAGQSIYDSIAPLPKQSRAYGSKDPAGRNTHGLYRDRQLFEANSVAKTFKALDSASSRGTHNSGFNRPNSWAKKHKAKSGPVRQLTV